jgi:hypothetical protein
MGSGAFCDQVAPIVAGLPGLISKVWPDNQETNTYPGVYLWRPGGDGGGDASQSRSSAAHTSELGNVSSTEFGVTEGPASLTRG